MNMNLMTDSEKLNIAFRGLRKLGYFARRHWKCCQSCGWAALPFDKEERAVFMHKQDEDFFKEKGLAYLAWSGDGNEIVKVLKDNGLWVRWDGESHTRILVSAEEMEGGV